MGGSQMGSAFEMPMRLELTASEVARSADDLKWMNPDAVIGFMREAVNAQKIDVASVYGAVILSSVPHRDRQGDYESWRIAKDQAMDLLNPRRVVTEM